MSTLDAPTRLKVAEDALKPHKEADRPCPYLTALMEKSHQCSKAGGVCSVQKYSSGTEQNPGVKAVGQKVAICPARLVSRSVLKSIAKTVLKLSEDVTLVKEVPYSFNMTKSKKNGQPTSAGRIDWLLVDGKDPKNFAAVETQAVYMSGKSQDGTFKAFVKAAGEMVMPPEYRHPDYKSSVPKRLAPQLESKARHLHSTSRKTVVIVDEFVRSNMAPLVEVAVPVAFQADLARSQQHKLEGCQVVFVIVSLENDTLSIVETMYSSIDAAKTALDAVAPMSKAEFEDTVLSLVKPVNSKGKPKPPRADKVFKLS